MRASHADVYYTSCHGQSSTHYSDEIHPIALPRHVYAQKPHQHQQEHSNLINAVCAMHPFSGVTGAYICQQLNMAINKMESHK